MMGAREFNLSRNLFAAAVWALLAGCWIGCSTTNANADANTNTMKSGKTGARSASAKSGGESAAGASGRPREVARAPLGALSASKWQFDNGLTAVLMPDATATSVAYTTWYRVGSRDEDEAAGQTGLAHLFEHLMFTQTRGQPLGEFDRAIESVGGNSNAMTYYDFTAYIDNVPPGGSRSIASMEADRTVESLTLKAQAPGRPPKARHRGRGAARGAGRGRRCSTALDELMYKQSVSHPPLPLADPRDG